MSRANLEATVGLRKTCYEATLPFCFDRSAED